jgi:hypothetical protein
MAAANSIGSASSMRNLACPSLTKWNTAAWRRPTLNPQPPNPKLGTAASHPTRPSPPAIRNPHRVNYCRSGFGASNGNEQTFGPGKCRWQAGSQEAMGELGWRSARCPACGG